MAGGASRVSSDWELAPASRGLTAQEEPIPPSRSASTEAGPAASDSTVVALWVDVLWLWYRRYSGL